jgi:hypothetical protein
MCAGSPRLGVLRRLRPTPDRSAVGAPSPTHPPDAGAQGKIRDGSRVHCGSLDEGGARLCPCGIAASTPQPFPAASLAAHAHRRGSSPPRPRRTGARRFQPTSTRFELAPDQGAVTRRFLAYSSPSRSPDPDHLAVLARPGFVRAAPTLPGTTRLRLPPAPPSCCDRNSGEGLSPPLEPQRLTAHVESARGAVPVLPPVRFPGPLAEPAVPISRQRALHGVCRQAGFAGGQGVGILLPR